MTFRHSKPKTCPTCNGEILDYNPYKLNVVDKVNTWMWVRFRLPRLCETDSVIRIKGISGIQKNNSPIGDWVWNGVYPIDSSFYPNKDGELKLNLPCHFAIHGITFMFGSECDNEDRGKLKDNYIYQLSVLKKWFHQGPMRMFPLVIDMEYWPKIQIPDVELPWIDEWDEHLIIPSMVPVNIQLEGVPFVPQADMDIVIGIVGDYVRAVC